MAFLTTNVIGGPKGNRFKLEGDWTGNSGDAAGTIQVAGGRCWNAEFDVQSATGPSAVSVPYSVSGPSASGYLTISVYNHEEVTAGRFSIEYA